MYKTKESIKVRQIPFGKPLLGEEEKNAVMAVLSGTILVHGPRSKDFEADFASYTKAPYAISVSSCTAALHLCYFYFGIGEDDEVIVPAQTHTATAHSVELSGAKPVFVDAERETGNIDIDQVEHAITSKTKALSVVHYLGMPVNMDRIMTIAKKHKLFVVEDCALAVGAYFKGIHAGLHGDAGCFSFYPVKHITTAEGGMLITKDKEMAEKIRLKRAFGVDRHVGERTIPGLYDVVTLGLNYRMSEIHAALGIEQLKRTNEFLKKRKENYEILSEGLQGVKGISQFVSSHGDYQSSYYCLSVILNEVLATRRFEIIQILKERGVGTSIYYPQPVPLFSYYKKKYGYKDDDFPVALEISKNSIALPVGPHLSVEDMEYIIESVKIAVARN